MRIWIRFLCIQTYLLKPFASLTCSVILLGMSLTKRNLSCRWIYHKMMLWAWVRKWKGRDACIQLLVFCVSVRMRLCLLVLSCTCYASWILNNFLANHVARRWTVKIYVLLYMIHVFSYITYHTSYILSYVHGLVSLMNLTLQLYLDLGRFGHACTKTGLAIHSKPATGDQEAEVAKGFNSKTTYAASGP